MTMPPMWKCELCGFEDTFENLKRTVVDTVMYLHSEHNIYALEEEIAEAVFNSIDDFYTVEQLLFRCPRCGHQESY